MFFFFVTGSPNSSDRDAGFCSGSEAGDDLSVDNSRLEPCSPTNTSEDSIEVKVPPTSGRNKRKSTEPSKVVCREQETGPLKKRIRYNTSSSSSESSFRPWTEIKQLQQQQQQQQQIHHHLQHRNVHQEMPNPAEIFLRHPGVTTLHLSSIKREEDYIQDEPLALVAKKPVVKDEMQSPQKSICNDDDMSNEFTTSPTSNSSGKRPPQRNYKNMTRERRIEANARERTRVHTISAAYETLRKSIPAYSNAQKLSKLSVLRVACSYILTLSRIAGEDYSHDNSEPSIADCTDSITKTIQTEGKIRKKKDE